MMRNHFLVMLLVAFCALLAGCGSDEDRAGAGARPDSQNGETISEDYVYEIPVIFHVLYQDASDSRQYVDDAWLREMLEHVNELYEGGVYAESVDMKVRFVPATTDEAGRQLETPGVEYRKYHAAYPIDPYAFMKDKGGANGNWQYLWEPNDYVNVMVYNFREDAQSDAVTLGISHLPYYASANQPDIEGLTQNSNVNLTKDNIDFAYCVSINSLYADKHTDDRYADTDRQMYYTTDVVATLAHELGHFLGLYHVFSEVDDDETACEDTDYCEDTPSYNLANYNEWVKAYNAATPSQERSMRELVRREPCDGEEYEATNIMDYAYCYSEDFTPDQAYRVRQVLYYSPLMPGPKKNRSRATRATDTDGVVDLPIRLMK